MASCGFIIFPTSPTIRSESPTFVAIGIKLLAIPSARAFEKPSPKAEDDIIISLLDDIDPSNIILMLIIVNLNINYIQTM